MAKKDSEKTEAEGGVVETVDSPLLDLSDAAVKRMIKAAKKRGFVTYAELNAVLPSEEVNSEQIEDILAMLNEMGINVVETEEHEEGEGEEAAEEEEAEGGDLVEVAQPKAVAIRSSEPADRTDDPVRMYLREMGSVELLSREGEIAIAKRIEAGREAMIAGLCESPLTFQAIIIWRDELNDSKVLLRDIIDLEATYAGPDGRNTPKIDMTAPAQPRPSPAPAGGARPTPRRSIRRAACARPARRRRPADRREDAFDEEDDMENSVSLSAMEVGIEAEGSGDFRPRGRRLQETAPPAGPERREQAQERDVNAFPGAEVQEAARRRSSPTSSRSRSIRTASKRWSSSSTTSTSA